MNNLLLGIILFFIMHITIWVQINGQFIWPWFKDNTLLLSLFGIPISYILIIATKYIVDGFDGLLWPGRFLGFAMGMIVMAVLTWYFLGEGFSTKTLTSLLIATGLVCIQIFWK
tara:strand:- start:95 stop:436 length:342 start_codon:yes stop_codon:yes gene_type:complete